MDTDNGHCNCHEAMLKKMDIMIALIAAWRGEDLEHHGEENELLSKAVREKGRQDYEIGG